MLSDSCTVVVMSCDKYCTAWYPYFELFKKYWPEHPTDIVLCTESLQYTHKDLRIRCSNSCKNATWSQRLIKCLNEIKTEYIIFSLEDFFFQAKVDHKRIEECYCYMREHEDIAVCRLKSSENLEQVLGEEVFTDFYLAGANVPYRLETQFALWRREILLSFLDESEDPWQFETDGTKRIEDAPYRFLWFRDLTNKRHVSNMIVPYAIGPKTGYGITWGKWLWKNRKLFADNHIAVNFKELGTYNKSQIRYRLLVNKAVWQKDSSLFCRCFAFGYRVTHKVKRLFIKS